MILSSWPPPKTWLNPAMKFCLACSCTAGSEQFPTKYCHSMPLRAAPGTYSSEKRTKITHPVLIKALVFLMVLLLKAVWASIVVRGLDLYSGGPGFKSSFLRLDGFVFGGPRFNVYAL